MFPDNAIRNIIIRIRILGERSLSLVKPIVIPRILIVSLIKIIVHRRENKIIVNIQILYNVCTKRILKFNNRNIQSVQKHDIAGCHV